MPRNVKCSDAFHDTRVGQPGHQDIIAIRPGPDGADILIEGLLCQACGKVFHDAKILDDDNERTARRAAIAKFRALFPSMTLAEMRRIFGKLWETDL